MQSRAIAPPHDGSEAFSDSWHRALDCRSVDVGSQLWVLRVVAIHADGVELWIRVANDDVPCEEIVLHVSRWTTVSQVLAAMKEWYDRTHAHPRVVRLLPTQ
jgi:hypothetical protein